MACLISGQKMGAKLVNLLIETNAQGEKSKDQRGDESKNGNA